MVAGIRAMGPGQGEAVAVDHATKGATQFLRLPLHREWEEDPGLPA